MINYVISQPTVQANPIRSLGSRLGSTLVDGGIDPRFSTHNFTALLQNGQFIEVVCPQDHPSTEQAPWDKARSRKAQLGGDWITWVLSTEVISHVEEIFCRSAVDGYRTRPNGSDLKWKQIGGNAITDSREVQFFIKWLAADHSSQDGKAVAAIEKTTIADTDHLADSWFESEILNGLNGAGIVFIDPSTDDGEYGIVAVNLTTPTGSIVLD